MEIFLYPQVYLYTTPARTLRLIGSFNLHLICSTSISAFIRRGAFISVQRIAFIFLDCILFNSLFNPIFNSLFNFISRIFFRIRIDIPFAFALPRREFLFSVLSESVSSFTKALVLLLGRHAGVTLSVLKCVPLRTPSVFLFSLWIFGVVPK